MPKTAAVTAVAARKSPRWRLERVIIGIGGLGGGAGEGMTYIGERVWLAATAGLGSIIAFVAGYGCRQLQLYGATTASREGGRA